MTRTGSCRFRWTSCQKSHMGVGWGKGDVSLLHKQRGVGAEQGKLRSLNAQGGRPVAHIVATNRGVRAKDAPAESAGGLARQKYICRGARCMSSSAVWKEWGLYNGAIGEAVGIIYRPCGRPPRSLPACVLVSFPKYCVPIFLPDLPNVVPIAPIERILDCRRRCSRTTAPLFPHGALLFTRAKGRLAAPVATQSAWSPILLRHLSKSRTQAAYTLPCPGIFRPATVFLASLDSSLQRSNSRLSAAASASSFASITL